MPLFSPPPPLHVTHPLLASSIDAWRARRGKPPPPRVTPRAAARAKAAFDLIDIDGSGALDAEELGAALSLLGCDPSTAAAALAAADADSSGELGYAEFARALAVGLAAGGGGGGGEGFFELSAATYARRRVLAALAARDGAAAVAAAEAAARALRGGEGGGEKRAAATAPPRRAAPPLRTTPLPQRGGWRHWPPPKA